MNITKEQIEKIKPYIGNLDEIIESDDIDALLDAVDDVVVANILENNDEPDDEGIALQRVWDQLYNMNY